MQLCFICWILPTMPTSMLPGCTHLLFPFLHAVNFPFSTFSHPTKKIADICMQAWRMSLTKMVCQTLSLMLIDGLDHSAVYNWHHWYQSCEIWDLSTLADKFGIVFETSKLKLAWWQFCFWKLDTHWKTIYYYSPSHLSTEWKESVADPDLQIRGGGGHPTLR